MIRFCPYCMKELGITTGGFHCESCRRSFQAYVHSWSTDTGDLLDVTFAYAIPIPQRRA